MTLLAGRYLSAAEAAEVLQVSRGTLYSYVSRGLLRSLPDPDGGRARRYDAQEVTRLRAKGRHARTAGIAAGVLDFGEPVLDSQLSLIDARGLFYRGRSATELAQTASLEQVARWLWLAVAPEAPISPEDDPFAAAPPDQAPPTSALAMARPDEALAAALPHGARADAAAWDLRPAATARTGARILRFMSTTMAAWRPGPTAEGPATEGAGPSRRREGEMPADNEHVASAQPPVAPSSFDETGSFGGRPGETARRLQRSWLPARPEAAEALDMALVLTADHGLNVSSFVARCVTSAQATPWAAVQAGLSALSGARHGGHTLRVTALLEEIHDPAHARQALAERLRRGESIPGFGHPLYPDGDPRATLLLRRAARLAPPSGLDLIESLVAASVELLDEHPTIDLGLVALTRALGLPPATPIALFALGRSVGWIAHALEQQASGGLIRPRARYVGPAPGTES